MKIDIAGIDFPVTLDLQEAKLKGTIPSELILRELRLEVDKYDGYKIRDTKYNRWRINNIDLANLIQGGVKIKIEANLKKREKIISLFGKTYYTPWISVTLHGTAEFSASITNNIIDVRYRSHDIKGQKWYSDIVEVLANDLLASEVETALEKVLSQFNGTSIVTFLKQGKVIETGGINIPLETILNSASASISIVSDGINFVIDLPKEVILT